MKRLKRIRRSGNWGTKYEGENGTTPFLRLFRGKGKKIIPSSKRWKRNLKVGELGSEIGIEWNWIREDSVTHGIEREENGMDSKENNT